MTYEIVPQDGFVEVHVSGKVSHWDLLKIVHALHKKDPKKETPDLWILDQDLDFSLHAFPTIIQGLLNLVARGAVKKGCKSAILAADKFQCAKVDIYCAEAAVLPYEIRAFTCRTETMDWLLS
ncbi:MAG: hypothetical protein ISR84_03740 [Kiritimatiellales bacterium]|nr:hypothetical protein [Kiritimatiellales bacterium]